MRRGDFVLVRPARREPVGADKRDEFIEHIVIFGDKHAHLGFPRVAAHVVHVQTAQPTHLLDDVLGIAQAVEYYAREHLRAMLVTVVIVELFHAVRLADVVQQCGEPEVAYRLGIKHRAESVLHNVEFMELLGLSHAVHFGYLGYDIAPNIELFHKPQPAVVRIGHAVSSIGVKYLVELGALPFRRDIRQLVRIGFCRSRRFALYLKVELCRKPHEPQKPKSVGLEHTLVTAAKHPHFRVAHAAERIDELVVAHVVIYRVTAKIASLCVRVHVLGKVHLRRSMLAARIVHLHPKRSVLVLYVVVDYLRRTHAVIDHRHCRTRRKLERLSGRRTCNIDVRAFKTAKAVTHIAADYVHLFAER